MNYHNQSLIQKAYETPSLRQNILNSGMIYLYCDFSGHDEQKYGGLACCMVNAKTIQVSAEKIPFDYPGDSVYGELLAIQYSLEMLGKALSQHSAKSALLYTDYSRIARLLFSNNYTKPIYEEARNRITNSLNSLKSSYPEVGVNVKYISRHKKNNALHQMAHLAARKTIGK